MLNSSTNLCVYIYAVISFLDLMLFVKLMYVSFSPLLCESKKDLACFPIKDKCNRITKIKKKNTVCDLSFRREEREFKVTFYL